MKILSFILLTIILFNFAACISTVKDGGPTTDNALGKEDKQKNGKFSEVAPEQSLTLLTGKVIDVQDGETITVLDEDERQHNVRLFGIDAPKLEEVFGKESQKELSGLISGETVTIEINKTGKDELLSGKVRLEGKDINYVQLLFGCARRNQNDRADQNPEDRQDYAEAETKAKQAKRGLWTFAKL